MDVEVDSDLLRKDYSVTARYLCLRRTSTTMAHISKVFSRHLSTSITRNAAIKQVIVIGGGLMGSGIAQVF